VVFFLYLLLRCAFKFHGLSYFVRDKHNVTGGVCYFNIRLVLDMYMQLRHLRWLNTLND
jgi:hypothetical protein